MKHLEFAARFPDSNYAALAAQRMLWLLERRMQAAGPNGSITQQFALRPLRREFLPRFVSELPRRDSQHLIRSAEWRDPYDWARQIDIRWWLYGLPAKERDLFSRELREGYIGQLRSKDGNIRIRAAYALAYLGDPAALEPLLELSESGDATLRPPVGAIARLEDPRAEPFLRARLNQAPSPTVIDGLAALRNPDIVPRMIKLTDADASWARQSACEALGVIAQPGAVPALRQRAGDGGRRRVGPTRSD